MAHPDPSSAVDPSGLGHRLLGLVPTEDPLVHELPLRPHLCRPDGAFFGGTGLAVALHQMELVTGRPALWATVQFVTSTQVGGTLTLRATVGAHGHATSQVRVQATVGGRDAPTDQVLFEALGSTASLTGRRADVVGVGPTMPRVPPPEDCEPFNGPGGVFADLPSPGQHGISDYLIAPLLDAPAGQRTVGSTSAALWARLVGETTTTSAKLGFLGDMVPLGVCIAAGVDGVGTSLDNSIRISERVDSEWILLDLQGHAARDGYGYGIGHMWSPDGRLIATSSQTAKLFDVAELIRRHRARAAAAES